MKIPLAIGLISLLPMSAWSVPVTSSLGGGDASFAAQAGAQRSLRGMVFGGFFTLYDFAVVSPLVPKATTLQISAVMPADEPAVGGPYAQPMIDELGAAPAPDVAPPIFLIPAEASALPAADPGADLFPAQPSQVIPGTARPLAPAANRLPEPSTLSLAALAAVVIVALSGKFARRQPRNSRRSILPTGLFGRSSRNSTIFGRL